MRMNRVWMMVFVCAVVAVTAAELRASDPVGVYGIIEKVVFEPNEGAPQRIQVWGVFAMPVPNDPNNYKPAQRGYLYYTLTPGKEDISRKEWADLKAVAGTGQAIAFGVRGNAKDRLRKTTDKPDSPDNYNIGSGVVKLGAQHYKLAELKKALSSQ